MEKSNIQTWNQFMKMTFFGMMMIAVLSIVSQLVDWSYYLVVNSRFCYYYDLYGYSYYSGTASRIVNYIDTTFWIYGAIWLFVMSKLVDAGDQEGYSLFKIGFLIYTSLLVLGYIWALVDGLGVTLALVWYILLMGCLIVMMIGTVKLKNSTTFPNAKGMSPIMLSLIFGIVSHFLYMIMYTILSVDYYHNINIFSYLGTVFSLVSDIFWLIGWVKLSKKL